MPARSSASCNPELWKEEDIRPAGTVTELTIATGMEGSVLQFGARFWEIMASHSPELKQRLVQRLPLRSVRYRDRYIRSPLSLRLLVEVMRALKATGDRKSVV